MKKIDFGAPPPPPPELPRPVPTELYSPTQYSGVQQYSPSRATSPASEDERPPPPTAASLPPRKVLGSDQAKRRLQAFAKSKMTNSPKGKAALIFADEEEELGKEKGERKKVPMVKDSTPVMASIMKEETESRETIKKNMEIIAKKAEDADLEMRFKEDKTRRLEDDAEGDLRDLLKKKREEKDLKEDSESNTSRRRSRSKERKSGRNEKRRNKSPKDSRPRSSGLSSDKRSKRKGSFSPDRSNKSRDRDDSPTNSKRSRENLDRRKQIDTKGNSRETSLRRKKDRSPSSEKGTGFGKFGTEKKARDLLEEIPKKSKFTEVRDRSQDCGNRGKDLRDIEEARDSRGLVKDSNDMKTRDFKDLSTESPRKKYSSGRRNSVESKDEGVARTRNESGDGRRSRKFSGEKKDRKGSSDKKSNLNSSVDSRDGRVSVAETKPDRKISSVDIRDQRSGQKKELDELRSLGRSDNSREREKMFSPLGIDPGQIEGDKRTRKGGDDSFERKRNVSSESKAEIKDQQSYQGDKIKKDIDLWELKHGNPNQSFTKEKIARSDDTREEIRKEQTIYIKAATEEDYLEVKQEHRDITAVGFIRVKDDLFIEFPCKFMRETSTGMTWSYNLVTSEVKEVEVKRNAHIRQSIDSLVSELEHETSKKRSRENSEQLEVVTEPVKSKKKKKTISKIDIEVKKGKKKRKLKKEEVNAKKPKKKKRRKDKEIADDIDLPDMSFELDHSIVSANTSPNANRPSAESVSVPLSAAGMSKLFSMAGYDPSSNITDNVDVKSDSYSVVAKQDSLSPSPLKSKRKISRLDQSPPPRSDSRHSKSSKDHSMREDMFSNRSFSSGREEATTPSKDKRSTMVGTPVQDDTDLPQADRIVMYENVPRRSLSERSPSPSLRGDLSRISGPRTPSPGPRLPKMKDSRSPSKVPIMRDRRSPLKQSPSRDVRRNENVNDRGRSPDKFELSKKKNNSRRNQRSQESSPRDKFLTEEDFIGKNYESGREKRQGSPRTSEHSGNGHAGNWEHTFISPGRGSYSSKGSPRGNLARKSEDKVTPQRRHASPDIRSKQSASNDDKPYQRIKMESDIRSPKENISSAKRRTSPSRNDSGKERGTSPGVKYDPINDSRDQSPEHKQSRAGFSDGKSRKKYSPERKEFSPGRRLDSPEKRPVSPILGFRPEHRSERSPGRIYSSPNRRGQSPRRRALSPEKVLPSPRHVSPIRRNRTPDRIPSLEKSLRTPERRPRTPDKRPRSPERIQRTPEKQPISTDIRPMTPERMPRTAERPRTPERRQRTPDRRIRSQDRRSVSPGRRVMSPVRRVMSPGRRVMSPGRRQLTPERRLTSPGRRPVSPGRRPGSPGRRPGSPGRRLGSPGRRPGSPGRRPGSPGRRPASPGRRPGSPGRRPGSPGRRPGSPGRKQGSPGRRPSSPGRRPSSPGRRPSSPGRRPSSPGTRPSSLERRPLGPVRKPLSPDRRICSPGRSPIAHDRRPYSPEHRTRSPDRRQTTTDNRHYSPDRRLRSPRSRDRRHSPGSYSPVGRVYGSPGRARRPHTPPYSPGRRNRTPEGRRFSPERRPHSPGRRRFSPAYDQQSRDRMPDSTISDADLARQMPPPSLHFKYKQFPGLASPAASGYSDSPKRLSLDERLEREHGIKIEHEQTPPMDFTRPPPGFPSVPTPFLPPGMSPVGPTIISSLPLSAGLPAMIPTYDDSTPPTPVKGPPYPGTETQKVASEKEQAIIAAQAVASKLQEMQAAKEDERKKKKDQKMAERMAQLEAKGDEKAPESKTLPAKIATGRILEEVEKQEIEKKEKDVKEDIKESEKKKHSEEKRKKRKDRDSPLLITLKPFYRPNDKKDKKKRKVEVPDPELTDEEFVPRSPVPLPDNSTLKPVLIKPNQTKLKLVSLASSSKKGVKYADGVLPGQGSPDQDFSPVDSSAPPTPPVDKPVKKRYKKVTITVITRHMGDTDSEEEGPPPPPPGSPPRYYLKDLIAMYGTTRPVETSA